MRGRRCRGARARSNFVVFFYAGIRKNRRAQTATKGYYKMRNPQYFAPRSAAPVPAQNARQFSFAATSKKSGGAQ